LPDVVAQFREYIRLDRKHRSGGLTPKEFERWTLLKRSLGRKFSPGLSDEDADQRSSVRVPAQLRVDFPSIEELYEETLHAAAGVGAPRSGASE